MLAMGNRKEKTAFGKTVGGNRLAELFERMKTDGVTAERLVFLCIGTDCSSGDSLGPLTGTLLQEAGFPFVVGTLERPCDAETWKECVGEIPSGCAVVAVDACLGQASSVGLFQIGNRPLEARSSLGLPLSPMGDYSIAAIVNGASGNPYRVLQMTPLGRVLAMARQIVSAALISFPPQRGSVHIASEELPKGE